MNAGLLRRFLAVGGRRDREREHNKQEGVDSFHGLALPKGKASVFGKTTILGSKALHRDNYGKHVFGKTSVLIDNSAQTEHHPSVMEQNTTFIEKVRASARLIAENGTPALSGLFDLTAQRLVRFAATISRHQQDAEDAVQMTLLTVSNRPKLLASAEQPWHYLLRMVRNDTLRIMRKKKSWTPLACLDQVPTSCAMDALETEDQNQAILAALHSLPQAQSEVVVLKIWESMTFDEVGSVLDISPATAASRYRYAIAKLSSKLQSHDHEAVQ